MIESAQLDAVRWYHDFLTSQGIQLSGRDLLLPEPKTWDHLAILRMCDLGRRECVRSVRESVDKVEAEIERRASMTGPVIDPTTPYQISGGILNLSYLIERRESRFDQILESIALYADDATFKQEHPITELSRISISRVRELVERARIHLHGQLWRLWALESGMQAEHMYRLITDTDRFPNHSADSIPLLAHPPIVVCTLASTAMIEEVGAEYINKLTPGSQNPDNTSCSRILSKLEKYGCVPESVSLESIEEHLIDERTSLAHYLRSRVDSVVVRDFWEYLESVLNALELADFLLQELFEESIDKYNNEVRSTLQDSQDSPQ